MRETGREREERLGGGREREIVRDLEFFFFSLTNLYEPGERASEEKE